MEFRNSVQFFRLLIINLNILLPSSSSEEIAKENPYNVVFLSYRIEGFTKIGKKDDRNFSSVYCFHYMISNADQRRSSLDDTIYERQQYVQIDDKRSEELNTNFGMPQGSILGPALLLYLQCP